MWIAGLINGKKIRQASGGIKLSSLKGSEIAYVDLIFAGRTTKIHGYDHYEFFLVYESVGDSNTVVAHQIKATLNGRVTCYRIYRNGKIEKMAEI